MRKKQEKNVVDIIRFFQTKTQRFLGLCVF